MKRMMKAMKALVAAAAVAIAGTALAATQEVGGLTWMYRIVDGEAEIINEDDSSARAVTPEPTGDVVIPTTLGGKTVTRLGNYALTNCQNIRSLVATTVKSVGEYALWNCRELQTASFPALETIGQCGFMTCPHLSTLEMPTTVDLVGNRAFVSCTSLIDDDGYVIINGVLYGYYASEKEVIIPASATRIASYAVYDRGITDVVIPGTVKSIGRLAFSDCTITNLTIMSGVEYIGAGAFRRNMNGLKSVTIPGSVKTIGDGAFLRCEDLKNVTILNGVETIESSAFRYCPIVSVSIPASVTTIGANSFGAALDLTYVYVAAGDGDRVKSLLSDAGYDKQVGGFTFVAPAQACQVTFNANGGYCNASPRPVKTSTAVGELPGAMNPGNSLDGWWTAATGGTKISKDTTVSANTTYYAHWTPNTYTVTFKLNGGASVSPATKDVTFGSTYGELPTPTREGDMWEFDGWWTAAKGGTEITSSSTVEISKDTTLYAHWTGDANYGTEMVGGITWTYRIVAGTAEIYNNGNAAIPTTTAGAVDVPSTLGGYPVTRIGDDAFDNCQLLTRVKIPSGVTSIGNYVFHSDEALRDLSIPSTVTSIDDNAFMSHHIKTIHVEAGDVDRVRALVEAKTSSTIYYVVGFPANDDFSGAALLADASGSVTVSNEGATREAEPLCVYKDSAGTTLWWAWVAPGNGKATFDTVGSTFDTVMGVYAGDSLDALTVVMENDDDISLPVGSRSKVTFNTVSGRIYYIAVGGINKVSGTLTLNWDWFEAPDYATILDAPAGMTFDMGGDKPWVAGGTVDGKTAVKSGLETSDHSKESTLIATFSGAGTLSFWYKVSSESGYDYLRVKVDGVDQFIGPVLSGTIEWTPYEIVLSAGDHTVEWTYHKDSGGSTGSDCAWIAGVNFGEASQFTKWTATFNANGGTIGGEATTTRQVYDGAAVGALPTPTRDGNWEFLGWFTEETGGTQIDASITISADVEYFAHWLDTTPPDYAAVLGAPAGMSFASSGDKTWISGGTVDEKTTVKSGDISHSQTSVLTATFSSGTAILSFYYKVSSESGCDTLVVTVDGDTVLSKAGEVSWTKYEAELAAGDHTVVWTYQKDHSQSSGSDSAWLAEVGLAALVKRTVTFDANGGTIGGESTTTCQVIDGAAVGTLPTPTRAGYWEFLGWFTEETGGTQIYATTTVTADVEYFAHWLSVTPPDFNAILGAPEGMSFSTSGNRLWISGGTVDEKTTVKSGDISHNQTSVLTATFSGAGVFSFYYKVSSESNCDYLVVTVDGDTVLSKAGVVSWTKYEAELAAGDHTVVWTYQKDHSQSYSSDSAWIADVNFVDASSFTKWTVTFNANGGTIGGEATATRQVVDGLAVGALPSATRDGYWAFDGWWTEATGGTQVEATTTVTADVEYFAHWLDTTPPDYASILGAPAGMSFASSGDKTWVAGGTVDEKTTVKSGEISHSQSSTLTATFSGPGTLSFWYKVESEQGSDILEVSIDGSGNCLGGTYQNSGTVSWTKFEEVLAAGDHTVVWTYSKDSGVSSELDCAWLAEVSFGEVAPPVQHTVTFNGNGGLVAGDVATTTLQVNDGAAVGPLPSATLTGYTLEGWFTAASGGTEIETTTPVTADVEYFAHWTPNKYTITFDANGGDSVTPASKQVTYDSTYGDLATATRAGYWEFAGWWTAASGGDQVTAATAVKITAAQTLYAHWTNTTPPPTQYTVTFNGNGGLIGGAATTTRQVNDGAEIGSLPTATLTGYTQNGWWTAADGGTEVYTDTSVTADTEVFAHWTPNTYTVYFDGNSGTPAEPSKTVTYDSTYGTLPSATRDGNWTLEGWWTTTDDSGVKVEETTTVKITDDQTLYAHWTDTTPTQYTVWFNANGGSCTYALTKVNAGAAISTGTAGELPTPTHTDPYMVFIGWFTQQLEGDSVGNDYIVNGNGTIYAHWNDTTPTPPSPTWTVEFNANGGTCSAEPFVVDDGATIGSVGALPTATRTGYTQNGWWTAASGGSEVTTATTISEDTEVYAHWTPNTYTVTFDKNGGDSVTPASKTVTYDATYGELPTPARASYWSFDGWFTASSGGDQVTAATPVTITAAQTLYAHWTETTPPPPTWTVTFNANGGSCVEDQRAVDDGDSIGALPAATRTGYTQNGWWTAADGGTEVYTDTSVTADTEVFAHWTPNTYTVYFDGNGGTPSAASITVTYDSTYGAMPTAELDGWSFDGWWTAAEGGTLVTASSAVTITDDQTLYAHWTDSGYVVTFDANGGVAEFDRVTREFSAAVGSMPQAVKDGCALLGWFTEPYGGGTEVTPATVVTASFTCYAVWNENDGDSIYKTAVVDGIEWTYRVLGSSAELYNRGNPVIPADTVGAITVPAKLDGMAVATIKDRAFYGCSGITAVVIPDGLTGIGVDAFAFCSSLEAVQCGKKVSGVDQGAFRYCTSLIAVEFKNANPIFPDDDMTTFEGANAIYWQINVPKTANKWPAEWRGRGVNKYPYSAHITVDFSDPAENPTYGKISTVTKTEIGTKLALKATANRGYASAGWIDGETGELITRAASYSYTVTGEDRVFLADFVTVEDDIASLAIALPDVTTATDGSIEIDLGAATESYSEPKFAVKGLPSGLKYDAKTQKITGKAAKPGIYTVEVKATNVSQKQATAASTATFEMVVPNKTDPEILVADSYGEYIPGVEYVETIPEAVGCKAAGLPTGMKWTEKDIVDKTTGAVITPAYSFYGAATKPGNYTVTFTKTIGKDKHEATATVAVGPLPKLTLTAVGYVDGSKVTGAGDYPANKGVSLKATAGAGNVFSCWIDVETGDNISRAANYTYTMADHDKTLYAEFTTAAEDAANLGLNVGGFAQYDKNKIMVDDNAVWNETTIPQGVYVEWPLVPQTVSLATITVSGLPTGLKFTAKDIVDSKTKAVVVPANTIYGVPTAASKYVSGVYTPTRVKIAMTTAGKVKSEYTLDVTVTAMEPWAVGPFNGGYNNICQATLTVASSGKISGKLLFSDGEAWTLAADSFSSFDGSIYKAAVSAKFGQETFPLTLRIGEGEIGGTAQLIDEFGGILDLWQTDWKSDKWKAIAAPFAKAGLISLGDAATWVTLKFDTSGAVKLAGEFLVDGTRLKASSSATVIPTEMYGDDGSFGGWVYIYFPPKAGKYDGIVRRQYLRWSAADKSFYFEPYEP